NAKGHVSTTSSGADFNLRHKYSTVNGFSGTVTEQGLEKLMNDPDVKNIYLNREVHITLDQSIPQIKANYTWPIQLNSTNITGLDETICIIDTGIDYNHTNLGDGWGNKVIGGYRSLNDKTDVQECDSNHSACFDDNSHGTHVAGIIISNDTTYRGVAPDAKLIAIKVMDSSGSGLYSDIIAGIDWCVNNASKFNISVISMSLGDKTEHNTYCNDDSTASSINSAVGAGIIVTVAAGNCDWVGANCTNGISSPACVENATPVGAVNDTDTIKYQRGNILNILAPGISIYSTIPGSWGFKTGTSMSTPHVAGAAALLKQFVRLYNGTDITPQEIEDVLNATGTEID
ncbi:S8 family serine peptidase, partial [Candidatus Woesearchaeota archaeon]|nr:S8 family serine peptidase [Candidatus Woesearchaeota archaeon]